MNFTNAFFAGVVGGLTLSIVRLILRWMRISEWNPELTLGSMATLTLTPLSWWLRFLMHLLIAGLIACVYALGFEYIARQAGWRLGLELAVVHMFIVGLVYLVMGVVHPLMAPPPVPESALQTPGLGAAHYGIAAFFSFVALHLVYGSIVGALYTTSHSPPDRV